MSENTEGRRPGDDGRESDQPDEAYENTSAHSGDSPWGPSDRTEAFRPSEDGTQAYPAGYGQQEHQPDYTQAYPPAGQYPPVHQPGQPYGYGSAPQYGQQAQGGEYGQPYGQPSYGQPAYGAPQYAQQGYGQEGYAATQGAYPAGYGGGYPPYGGYGQPQKSRGPLVAWIVLAVLLFIAIVVGILYGTGVIGGDAEPTAPDETIVLEPTGEAPTPTPTIEPPSTPSAYGDDPELDALWDSCAEGDMNACDELYFTSGFDTEYEEFGATCGGTRDGSSGLCTMDVDSGPSVSAYGADPMLDEMWDACEAGDFEACDELWWNSPIDSDYEMFAETCGGRTEGSLADCVARSEIGEIQP